MQKVSCPEEEEQQQAGAVCVSRIIISPEMKALYNALI